MKKRLSVQTKSGTQKPIFRCILGLCWLFFSFTFATQAQITIYTATLSGPAEAPPNASPGTGSVIVTVNTTLNTMRVQCTFSGLTGNTTASHIHAATTTANTGTAGVATQTPTFSGFPLGVTSGTYDQTFDMTLAASYNAAFITANGGSVTNAFAALKAALDANKAYFNIHTSTFGGGEIRGFLTPAITWTGAMSIDWNTPGNWITGVVPTATDDVTIPSAPTNQPTIGAGTTGLAKSVHVQSGATLTLAGTAGLTVSGNRFFPGKNVFSLYNEGTVENSGQIILSNTAGAGYHGLDNRGTFHNKTGGEIKIDNATQAAIFSGGAFTNAAKIIIGAGTSVGNYGILSVANFTNNTGGDIKIDNATSTGLWSNSGIFTNVAKITIGGTGSVGNYGIYNQTTFNNNIGGTIKIDRVTDTGLAHVSGTFTNDAQITIGANNSVGLYGLYNQAVFNNNNGGQIGIDRSTSDGLVNDNGGTITNLGTIDIGGVETVGSHGIRNQANFNNNAGQITINRAARGLLHQIGTFNNGAGITIGSIGGIGDIGLLNLTTGTFNNNSGGQITIDRSTFAGMINQGTTFNNAGVLTIGSGDVVGQYGLQINDNGTFNNNVGGEIKIDRSTTAGLYINTGNFTNFAQITLGAAGSVGTYGIRNEATLSNSGCNSVIKIISDNIISNTGTFTNAGSIIENAAGNSSITSNTGVVQNLNGGTFSVGSGNAAIASAGDIWIGCTSTDWATAGNWLDGTVPTTGDDVTIPNVTNKPIIGAGTAAVAKSVLINHAGAQLTLLATGSLAINGAASPRHGLDNYGTLDNNGTIRIGNTAALGAIGMVQRNGGTLNNKPGGAIYIDQTGSGQGFYTSGAVNNEATVEIGSNAAVVGQGLYIESGTGNFTNKAGSLLTINRVTVHGLENKGTLDNSGTIRIGNTAAITGIGIVHRNGGIFNNKPNAAIYIDQTGSGQGFYTSGAVNNEATVEIGSNAAVVGQGLYIESGTGTFTNKTGSLLTINRATVHGLENKGALDNSGTIRIGNIAAITGSGIVHRNGGTFNNKPNAAIYIDRTGSGQAFYSAGLVNNEAPIKIGSNAAVTGEGIRVEGNTFNNKPGGSIQIDQTSSRAITLAGSGIFNNETIIEIGSNTAINASGIRLEGGTFNNNTGGDIKIDRTSGLGIINFATFNNSALLTLGNSVLSNAQDGIQNQGTFTNNAAGIISIQKPWGNGIWHSTGTFQNAGKITISNVFNTVTGDFSTGILSTAPFINTTGAEIHLDQVQSGIITTKAFTNAGLIRIGENAPLTGMGIGNLQGAAAVFNNNAGGEVSIKQTATDGIQNDVNSVFNNNACAKLTIFDNLNNSGTFTNAGLFTVNTTQAHTNTGTLTNDGIIEYPQGNPIPNVTNNDMIIAPLAICGTVFSPALQLGGANNFTAGSTWYSDALLTVPAGTYNQAANTFTLTNLVLSGTQTMYFSVSDAGNPCPRTVSIQATFNVLPTSNLSASQVDVCPNTEVTLNPNCSVPNATINWNPGAPTVTPDAATASYVYKVSCTIGNCTSNESSVEVRTHRILADLKNVGVGTQPKALLGSVKDNLAPTNTLSAPASPRLWTILATGCSASESAVFKLSGPISFNSIDNNPPYALFANVGSDYFAVDHPNYGSGNNGFPNGTYTLTVELRGGDGVGGPFPKNRVATGALLATRSLQFTLGNAEGRQGVEETMTGLNEESWLSIGQNPVSTEMVVRLSGRVGQTIELSLVNLQGQPIQQRSVVLNAVQQYEVLNVDKAAAGLYILKGVKDTQIKTLKVVKVQ
ncbi:MAG: CHRD domain-containing protein [Spirosomataceae bacterium]